MIEILESRIAPSAVFFFTDVDGDHVKITSTKGTNAELAAAVTLGNAAQSAVGKPHQLQTLTLNSAFEGASISITATPSDDLVPGTKSGDGFVNVGEILATGVDLKSVTVHGDLGQIVVGGGTTKGPGLVSLNVESMGAFGNTTGANDSPSRFINGVTSIKVAHDVTGVLLRADASGSAPTAKIGSVFIGGDLIGATASTSETTLTDTGEIAAVNGIGSVKIMGSVIGTGFTDTGRISATLGNIGSIFIGGNLVGGSAQASGSTYSNGNIGSVTIKGSVIGGSAVTSGGIDSGTIGTVTIGGNLVGTPFISASDVDHTAFIRAQGNLKKVTIEGSIISGSETGGGTLTFSGAIQAGQTLGAVKVGGSILGTAADTVIISGKGLAAPTKKTQDPAIGSVTVLGSATYAMIEGGYDVNGNASSGDAQIGSVAIGGDLIASDIIAGVKSSSAEFGNSSDTLIGQPTGVATDGILSTIAKIVVGGEIEGTLASGDIFGIEAQMIGSIKTGNLSLQLPTGAGGFYVSQTTGHDVHIRKLAGS